MSELHASLAAHRGDASRKSASPVQDIHSGLERQSLGRALNDMESAFADALEDIYASGIDDFEVVARQLTERGVRAPKSRETLWTVALLQSELSAVNASLDDAYEAGGRSA